MPEPKKGCGECCHEKIVAQRRKKGKESENKCVPRECDGPQKSVTIKNKKGVCVKNDRQFWNQYLGFGVTLSGLQKNSVLTPDHMEQKRAALVQEARRYGIGLIVCGLLLVLMLVFSPSSGSSEEQPLAIQMGGTALVIKDGVAAPREEPSTPIVVFVLLLLATGGACLTLRYNALADWEGLSQIDAKQQEVLNNFVLKDMQCAQYVQKVLHVRPYVCVFEFEILRAHMLDKYVLEHPSAS